MSIYRELLQTGAETAGKGHLLGQDEYDHYQALHHMLDQLVKSGNGVTFSATHPGTGATDVIYQLSAYFSDVYKIADQRVLVIDGNCLNPQLHQLYGVENSMGLSELFLSAQFEKLVHRDVLPQIDFISNGAGRLYVPETFLGGEMSDVAQQLAAYRYVLIDSPPIFAHPDTMQLGRVFGNTVLVCEYGKSKADLVSEAKRRLESAGIQLVGAVVNKYKHSIPAWIYDRI